MTISSSDPVQTYLDLYLSEKDVDRDHLRTAYDRLPVTTKGSIEKTIRQVLSGDIVLSKDAITQKVQRNWRKFPKQAKAIVTLVKEILSEAENLYKKNIAKLACEIIHNSKSPQEDMGKFACEIINSSESLHKEDMEKLASEIIKSSKETDGRKDAARSIKYSITDLSKALVEKELKAVIADPNTKRAGLCYKTGREVMRVAATLLSPSEPQSSSIPKKSSTRLKKKLSKPFKMTPIKKKSVKKKMPTGKTTVGSLYSFLAKQ